MQTDTDTDAARSSTVTASTDGGGRRRRRAWIAAGAVVALALIGFVFVWFEPHKAFVDERVDQDVPTADPTTTETDPGAPDAGQPSEPPATTAPAEPVDLAGGSFASLDHATSGTVRLLELADGQRFVRLQGFETDNGPDLYVYLSTNPAGGPEGAFDDEFANLGPLQGNIGDQNYEVPGDLDPTRYASVVIWCDRFDSAFGAADLATAPT